MQSQVRQRFATLQDRIEDQTVTDAVLGAAYGELAMMLMVAGQHTEAEPAFVNAQMLMPDDNRWPYYLGHLYQQTGRLNDSLSAFDRVRGMQPDDLATLVHLGNVNLELGKVDHAADAFDQAVSLAPDSAAARIGLGRAALLREDFERAVQLLEEVRTRQPDLGAVHYPLGLAYRGLGEQDKAEEHLRQRQDTPVPFTDPLMDTLEALLVSSLAFEQRGVEALEAEDWAAAEAQFREGLQLDPGSASLQHRLGTALYMQGDIRGALRQFETAVRTSPTYVPALYSLGVLYQELGRFPEAVDQLAAVVTYEPGYPAARMMLADNLRRAGDPRAALPHYEQVLAAEPDMVAARFGRAMAYVQMDRYQEARRQFEREMAAYPNEPVFVHALVRLLAAAPDVQVRDGRRALELIEPLVAEQRTPDLGETLAMVLAELGQFDEAAAIQQELVDGARDAGMSELARRLSVNLSLYESGQPCRSPWISNAYP